MRKGYGEEGKANEYVDLFLKEIDFDKELGEVGIHRGPGGHVYVNQRQTQRREFSRQHREIDVTSFGDATPQTMVVQPGFWAGVTGTEREINLYALTLLVRERARQIEMLNEEMRRLSREGGERAHAIDDRNAALLILWDTMGKKRRKELLASHPDIWELVKALVVERKQEREAEAWEASEDW